MPAASSLSVFSRTPKLLSCWQRDLQDRLHSWIPSHLQQTAQWPRLPLKST